jgi:hypothetical protein
MGCASSGTRRMTQAMATEQLLLFEPRTFGARGFEVRRRSIACGVLLRWAAVAASSDECHRRSARRLAAGEGAHAKRRRQCEARRPLVGGRIESLVACQLAGRLVALPPLATATPAHFSGMPPQAKGTKGTRSSTGLCPRQHALRASRTQLTFAILTNDVKLDTSHVDAIEELIRVRSSVSCGMWALNIALTLTRPCTRNARADKRARTATAIAHAQDART